MRIVNSGNAEILPIIEVIDRGAYYHPIPDAYIPLKVLLLPETKNVGLAKYTEDRIRERKPITIRIHNKLLEKKKRNGTARVFRTNKKGFLSTERGVIIYGEIVAYATAPLHDISKMSIYSFGTKDEQELNALKFLKNLRSIPDRDELHNLKIPVIDIITPTHYEIIILDNKEFNIHDFDPKALLLVKSNKKEPHKRRMVIFTETGDIKDEELMYHALENMSKKIEAIVIVKPAESIEELVSHLTGWRS